HDQNSWNNYAEAGYTQFLSRRWILNLNDSYQTSKDPSRILQNSLLILPRSQYRENAFRGSINFQQSERTGYTVQYDNTAMTFGEYDPLQRSILDSLSNGASFTVGHMLRRTHRIRVTYSIFNTKPWNHQRLNEDHVATEFVAFKQPAHRVSGEY